MIGETLIEDSIVNMTEDSYKNHVKKLIEKAAFKYLNELKESHSKVKENKYKGLEAQTYILSHQFSNNKKSTLFMLDLIP